jgi:hypothetical protein
MSDRPLESTLDVGCHDQCLDSEVLDVAQVGREPEQEAPAAGGASAFDISSFREQRLI